VIEAVAAWYREPLFWLFPVASTMVAMVAFAAFAAPLTWLAWRAPASLDRYRIQSRRPRPQDLVGPSIRSWLVNNAWMIVAVVLSWPLLRLSGVHWGELPSWPVVLGQVVFFIYLDDFLFYWMHRALHTRRLYKSIHAWHHTILTPWAITGNYMHPLEFVLIGTTAMIGPILLGSHVVTLWAWLVFRQWEAAEGHCGYDFPWSPTHWLPLSDGARHHDVHHARVKGNYAGFLYWTDLVFGTLSRGYRQQLAERHPVVVRSA
jgi:4-alpha-methyl-delta7-sterol-4alpha-methyl oxidase